MSYGSNWSPQDNFSNRGGRRDRRGGDDGGRGDLDTGSDEKCHQCGMFGHVIRFCPHQFCIDCGERGHAGVDCPNPSNDGPSGNTQGKSPGRSRHNQGDDPRYHDFDQRSQGEAYASPRLGGARDTPRRGPSFDPDSYESRDRRGSRFDQRNRTPRDNWNDHSSQHSGKGSLGRAARPERSPRPYQGNQFVQSRQNDFRGSVQPGSQKKWEGGEGHDAQRRHGGNYHYRDEGRLTPSVANHGASFTPQGHTPYSGHSSEANTPNRSQFNSPRGNNFGGFQSSSSYYNTPAQPQVQRNSQFRRGGQGTPRSNQGQVFTPVSIQHGLASATTGSEAITFDHRNNFVGDVSKRVAEEKETITTQDENMAFTIHELRKAFATASAGDKPEIGVKTNYFTLTLPNDDTPLYQFDITGMTQRNKRHDQNSSEPRTVSLPRGQKEYLFKRFIENCPVLRDRKTDYAADGMSLIISWTDLRSHFDLANAEPGAELFALDVPFKKRGHDESSDDEPSLPSAVVESLVPDAPTSEQEEQATTLQQTKKLRLVYRGPVLTSDLTEFSQGRKSYFAAELAASSQIIATGDIPIAPEHALNIVIAKAGRISSSRIFRIGKNKMFLEDTMTDLIPGIVAYKGFFSTVKVGMGQVLVNISLTTSAFYKPLRLDDFLFPVSDEYMLESKKTMILKLRVKVCHSYERTRTIQSFGAPPREQTFDRTNGGVLETITVADYFAEKYPDDEELIERIAVSDVPCINTRQVGSEEWFPAEVLEIAKFQPYRGKIPASATEKMIEVAREGPYSSLKRIEGEGLRLLGALAQGVSSSTLNKASINIDTSVLQVPARQVDCPRIGYQTSTDVLGPRWNLHNKKFWNTENPLKEPIVVLFPNDSGISIANATEYAKGLLQQMETMGIQTSIRGQNRYTCRAINFQTSGRTAFDNCFRTFKNRPLFVFVNLDKSARHALTFDAFKQVAEQQYGLHTVCITHSFLKKNQRNATQTAQYFANVAMKVNLKLGNVNHAVVPDRNGLLNGVNLSDTIILGADVTHTQKDSDKDACSLAALVGSVDESLGNYYGSMACLEKDTEVIGSGEMRRMVKQRLSAFFTKTKKVPINMIYYRDGVDPGQYAKVRQIEVQALKSGYREFANEHSVFTEPNVTVVIVTKRHHTRFFPINMVDESSENCQPGTCVDSGVTHPSYFDFFLQSHKPVAGTARSTYYICLENGMNLSEKDLQNFTNSICYFYVRATLPVGYAPPAYYADRLCERARCYFADFLKPGLQPPQTWLERYYSPHDPGMDRTKVHGPWHTALNDTMFWM